MLDGYAGYLVRDDYAAWHQFDAQLAGVQQCVQHLFRHLQGVLDLHKDWQAWAGQVRQVLGEAAAAVEPAKRRQPPLSTRSYSMTCGNATTTRCAGG